MNKYYGKPGKHHARYYQLLKEEFPKHPKVRVAISIEAEGVKYTCWAYPPPESNLVAIMGIGHTFFHALSDAIRDAAEHPESLRF